MRKKHFKNFKILKLSGVWTEKKIVNQKSDRFEIIIPAFERKGRSDANRRIATFTKTDDFQKFFTEKIEAFREMNLN